MYPIQSDVAYTDTRNRITVLFRLFLLIPHMIVLYLWNIANSAASIAQWFIILFTGKRNEGIFKFQANYAAYVQNVGGYGLLLHDKFPAFGEADPDSPARYEASFRKDANRLTSFFRPITMIPAAFLAMLYGIAIEVITLISWFIIVITGRQPRGMWEFNRKAFRILTAVQGYYFLMTDEYPWPKVTMQAANFDRPAETAPWRA